MEQVLVFVKIHISYLITISVEDKVRDAYGIAVDGAR